MVGMKIGGNSIGVSLAGVGGFVTKAFKAKGRGGRGKRDGAVTW